MRIAVMLASAGVVLILAGCSGFASLNPFSGHSVRNQPAALVDIKPSMAVRTAWKTSIGSSDVFTFSPVVVGYNLFVASADGALAKIEAATGKTVWNAKVGSRLTAGVGSDGTTIAVVAEKGLVIAFDADGKQRWKAQASSEVLSAPAVGQGLVLVRSVDNRIAAFDAESGVRRWVAQRTSPALTLRSAPGILIYGKSAFVSLPGGRLLALSTTNGAPLWEAVVGDPRGATELERIADTAGTPIISGRAVCAVAYQGRVACFDINTGAPRWAKTLSSDVGLAADVRYVFASDDQGAVNAFTSDSGTSVWRNSLLAHRRLTAPISFGPAVVVGDFQGYVHFLSKDDGALLARLSTDGSPMMSAPVLAASNLIFQTQSGTVVAIAAE